jgi:PHD/YefM family antitoxin component YafN of YafNO toxin-antitoxin module
MKTYTATTTRKELFSIFSNIINKHEIYNVNYKDKGIVLINQDDYEELIETLELLSDENFKKKLQKAENEISNNQTYKFDEIFK